MELAFALGILTGGLGGGYLIKAFGTTSIFFVSAIVNALGGIIYALRTHSLPANDRTIGQ